MYKVKSPTANSFKLRTISHPATIDLTSLGAGTHRFSTRVCTDAGGCIGSGFEDAGGVDRCAKLCTDAAVHARVDNTDAWEDGFTCSGFTMQPHSCFLHDCGRGSTSCPIGEVYFGGTGVCDHHIESWLSNFADGINEEGECRGQMSKCVTHTSVVLQPQSVFNGNLPSGRCDQILRKINTCSRVCSGTSDCGSLPSTYPLGPSYASATCVCGDSDPAKPVAAPIPTRGPLCQPIEENCVSYTSVGGGCTQTNHCEWNAGTATCHPHPRRDNCKGIAYPTTGNCTAANSCRLVGVVSEVVTYVANPGGWHTSGEDFLLCFLFFYLFFFFLNFVRLWEV